MLCQRPKSRVMANSNQIGDVLIRERPPDNSVLLTIKKERYFPMKYLV